MNDISFSKSTDLYNMILGGLIALTSDQKIGKVACSSVSETLFLGKWLKRIKKQKRYPRALTNEIDNFLHLYAIEGRSATSKDHEGNNYFQLTLFPENKCNGEAAIPTKFLN